MDANNYETFSLIDDEELEHFDCSTKEISDDDMDNLNMWLYLKDKFQISNEARGELSRSAKEVPNLYKMTKQMKELSSKWIMKPTPGDMEGIQISFVEGLEENVRRLKLNKVIIDGDNKIKWRWKKHS